MKSKKNNLLIHPQGIGDLAIPLKYFIFNIINKKKTSNDFIIQYQSQKDIIENYNKSDLKFFFSKIFYKFSISNIKEILTINRTHYENIFIDPNVSILKAILISIILDANNKIYKKFLFYKLFFNESPDYSKNKRIEYYKYINKKYLKNNLYLKFKKIKNNKTIFGIAPGTGSLEKHKRWPWIEYVKLINNLKIKPDEIYIFGNEKNIADLIANKIKFKSKIIRYKNINRSLKKLLSIKMLITNDNGIANFAAIYGVKCYIISGPNIPGPIKNLSNVNIIKQKMSCLPCYELMRYGCGIPVCLTTFEASKVRKKINLN